MGKCHHRLYFIDVMMHAVIYWHTNSVMIQYYTVVTKLSVYHDNTKHTYYVFCYFREDLYQSFDNHHFHLLMFNGIEHWDIFVRFKSEFILKYSYNIVSCHTRSALSDIGSFERYLCHQDNKILTSMRIALIKPLTLSYTFIYPSSTTFIFQRPKSNYDHKWRKYIFTRL